MLNDATLKRAASTLVGFATGLLMASGVATAEPDARTHDDWTLRCQARENALPCDMVQTIIDKPSGKQVLAFSIAWSPTDDKHALQIILPLGVRLEPGLAIRIDEDFTVKGIRITRCETSGCFVEAIMENTLLEAMQNGSGGAVIIVDAARQPVALPFSLKGFTAAHQALQKETIARMATP